MQVVVDSLLTHYEQTGKGKTILFLHGWADSAKGMQPLWQALAAQYQIVALDLPGFGGTDAPPNVWGLPDYAQFVAHFLQKTRLAPYAVVAHSNGGAIALRAIAQQLLAPKKLVLMASAGIRGVNKSRLRALRVIAKAGKVLAAPLPPRVQRRLRAKLYHSAGSDMLVAPHLQETFKKVVADDVRGDAAQVQVPTLLIYGQQDTAAPPWFGEAFHQILPTSTLMVLTAAGHFVHQDETAKVARAIQEFLQ